MTDPDRPTFLHEDAIKFDDKPLIPFDPCKNERIKGRWEGFALGVGVGALGLLVAIFALIGLLGNG